MPGHELTYSREYYAQIGEPYSKAYTGQNRGKHLFLLVRPATN